MPVPTLISQLSTTASLNSPDGAVDVPSSIDDYQRAHAAFIAQLYAGTVAAPTVIVPSATTTDIGAAASENVDISGTTTITGFGTVAEGINRKGRFTNALILTHNATSLILPGNANITTAENDRYEAQSLGGGNWIVTKYVYANGSVISATLAAYATNAPLSFRNKIINGDIFVEDFSKATVLTMYLLPDLNLKLRPTILKMAPGTRVVTNSFHMGDGEEDALSGNGYTQGYYWVVPGNAAGKWTIKGIEGKTATLDISQSYQRVGGTMSIDGKAQPILGPSLVGNRLKFSFIDQSGQSRIADVTLKGNTFAGNVVENSPLYEITGTRN